MEVWVDNNSKHGTNDGGCVAKLRDIVLAKGLEVKAEKSMVIVGSNPVVGYTVK